MESVFQVHNPKSTSFKLGYTPMLLTKYHNNRIFIIVNGVI